MRKVTLSPAAHGHVGDPLQIYADRFSGHYEVYNTVAGANTVHDGLYIADASVIPGPLAVNPALSIVAMAQKIAAAIP